VVKVCHMLSDFGWAPQEVHNSGRYVTIWQLVTQHDCPGKYARELRDVAAQVRAFGKEAAACDRYRDAVLKMQGWGLKSAALGGFFGGFNATFTTGAAPSHRLQLAVAHCLCRLCRLLATCKA